MARRRPVGPALARGEQGLVVAEPLGLLEQEQLAGEVLVARGEEHRLDRPAGVLPVGQHQGVAPHVLRPQGQHLGDPAPGGPQRPQQQPVALGLAAAITALTSSGVSPSGGCQRFSAPGRRGPVLGRHRRAREAAGAPAHECNRTLFVARTQHKTLRLLGAGAYRRPAGSLHRQEGGGLCGWPWCPAAYHRCSSDATEGASPLTNAATRRLRRAAPDLLRSAAREGLPMLGPPKARHVDRPVLVSLEDLVPPGPLLPPPGAGARPRASCASSSATATPAIGRPSLDPVVFFKLQLMLFFEGLRSERKLVETASLHLAHRWYLGYALDEPLPDHSTLTKIRQRLGVEVFRRFFEHVVELCQAAGLVLGQGAVLRRHAGAGQRRRGLGGAPAAGGWSATTSRPSSPRAATRVTGAPARRRRARPRAAPGDRRPAAPRPAPARRRPRAAPAGDAGPRARRGGTCWSGAASTRAPPAGRGLPAPVGRAGQPHRPRRHAHAHRRRRAGPCWATRPTTSSTAAAPGSSSTPWPRPATCGRASRCWTSCGGCASGGGCARSARWATPSTGRSRTSWPWRTRGSAPTSPWPTPSTGTAPTTRWPPSRYDAERDEYRCPQGQPLRRDRVAWERELVGYVADPAVCNACPVKAACTPGTTGRHVHRSLHEAYLDRVRAYHATESYKKAMRKRGGLDRAPVRGGQAVARPAPVPPPRPDEGEHREPADGGGAEPQALARGHRLGAAPRPCGALTPPARAPRTAGRRRPGRPATRSRRARGPPRRGSRPPHASRAAFRQRAGVWPFNPVVVAARRGRARRRGRRHHPAVADDEVAALRAFRAGLYVCFTRRRDALFEVLDAVLTAGAVPSLPHLSLAPGHRRGWGSVYAALRRGHVYVEALRALLVRQPMPAGPPLYAVDVSVWPRPGATTSPERGYQYHSPRRRDGRRPRRARLGVPVAGPAQPGDRDSWTAPVDVRRVRPEEKPTAVAVEQLKALVAARPAAQRGEVPLVLFDAGYDASGFTHALAGTPVGPAHPAAQQPPLLVRPRPHDGAPAAAARSGTAPSSSATTRPPGPRPTAELRVTDEAYGQVRGARLGGAPHLRAAPRAAGRRRAVPRPPAARLRDGGAPGGRPPARPAAHARTSSGCGGSPRRAPGGAAAPAVPRGPGPPLAGVLPQSRSGADLQIPQAGPAAGSPRGCACPSRPTAGPGWCSRRTPSCASPAGPSPTTGCRGSARSRRPGSRPRGCTGVSQRWRGACPPSPRRQNPAGAPRAGPKGAARRRRRAIRPVKKAA